MRRHDVTRSRAHRAAPLPLSTSHDSCVTRVPARPRLPLFTSHDSCVTCSWVTTRGQRDSSHGSNPPRTGGSIDRARDARGVARPRARACSPRRDAGKVFASLCAATSRLESARGARARWARSRVWIRARARCRRGTTTRAVVGAGERRIESSRTRCDRRRGFARARTGTRTRRRR